MYRTYPFEKFISYEYQPIEYQIIGFNCNNPLTNDTIHKISEDPNINIEYEDIEKILRFLYHLMSLSKEEIEIKRYFMSDEQTRIIRYICKSIDSDLSLDMWTDLDDKQCSEIIIDWMESNDIPYKNHVYWNNSEILPIIPILTMRKKDWQNKDYNHMQVDCEYFDSKRLQAIPKDLLGSLVCIERHKNYYYGDSDMDVKYTHYGNNILKTLAMDNIIMWFNDLQTSKNEIKLTVCNE